MKKKMEIYLVVYLLIGFVHAFTERIFTDYYTQGIVPGAKDTTVCKKDNASEFIDIPFKKRIIDIHKLNMYHL